MNTHPIEVLGVKGTGDRSLGIRFCTLSDHGFAGTAMIPKQALTGAGVEVLSEMLQAAAQQQPGTISLALNHNTKNLSHLLLERSVHTPSATWGRGTMVPCSVKYEPAKGKER